MKARSRTKAPAKRALRPGKPGHRRKNGSTATVARIAGGFKIGRESFAAISAIEGLHLTAEMERALREFDRKGLSPEERRRAIIAKHCK
jgi:hypothetical protein